MTDDRTRMVKLERAFRHWVYRNHPHIPSCEGCVEAAAFLALPGYQGAPQPLVDGH